MRRRQIREALGSEREALLSQLTEQTVSQIWTRIRLSDKIKFQPPHTNTIAIRLFLYLPTKNDFSVAILQLMAMLFGRCGWPLVTSDRFTKGFMSAAIMI